MLSHNTFPQTCCYILYICLVYPLPFVLATYKLCIHISSSFLFKTYRLDQAFSRFTFCPNTIMEFLSLLFMSPCTISGLYSCGQDLFSEAEDNPSLFWFLFFVFFIRSLTFPHGWRSSFFISCSDCAKGSL